MQYQSNLDLPLTLRGQLSELAQDLYRIVYNSALHAFGDEERAHRMAWSAIRIQAARLQ
ncbi:cation transport regulator ChaB [Synechococcales cyanobacterium C]|uniref:Cation transport regulator ChaB n=1 Tax=Petrachloros mirabilis ULC683 TaxID=2781853 RepID=A0A8K2A076_9CYAN|nr:ChaB family protein [Petrachloros mirabilis]NCJ07336.1 cation transport regulator ChaB [Petrachloros mirabilis ULC683]